MTAKHHETARLCLPALPVWALLCAALLPLPGVRGEEAPYLRYEGGGFIFNYRVAIAYYGIVVRPARPMPAGSVIEARFADPAGGADIVGTVTYERGARPISFETPPLHGIREDTDYPVTVTVRDPAGNEIAAYTYQVHSDLDQSVLPEKPLVVGPGYQLNTLGEPGPGAASADPGRPAGTR